VRSGVEDSAAALNVEAAVYVEMGRLGRPYGVTGWSHVESWTEPPAALLGYRRWFLKGLDGLRRPAQMQGARVHGSGLVARVDGSETPERAAELTGTIIEVARSDFAAAPPGEYYRDDLLGSRSATSRVRPSACCDSSSTCRPIRSWWWTESANAGCR
jgi:16S rRNA processing protein RimM